jgi:hypothetical protein
MNGFNVAEVASFQRMAAAAELFIFFRDFPMFD